MAWKEEGRELGMMGRESAWVRARGSLDEIGINERKRVRGRDSNLYKKNEGEIEPIIETRQKKRDCFELYASHVVS